MVTTQDNRLLEIRTPLGDNFLLISRFEAVEGISQLFRIEAELLHEETAAGYEPHVVDPKSLLGKSVTILVNARDGESREFTGIVNEFTQGTRHTRFSHYKISIVPHVWLLTQKHQSRIFQQKNVPDILKQVFEGFEFKFALQTTYEPRNYCVQYRETDFAFASRLMEEEGIFYYFEHTNDTHKMIVANDPQSHQKCPSKDEIPCFLEVADEEDWVSSIGTWRLDYKLQSGKVTLWDNHFQLPNKKLEAEQPALVSIAGNQELEIYDYPA